MHFKTIVIILFLCQDEVKMDKSIGKSLRDRINQAYADAIKSFKRFKENVTSFFKATWKKMKAGLIVFKDAVIRFVKTIKDIKKKRIPETIKFDENLESIVSTPEIMARHGYRVEAHTVLTQDGYMLALHRVMPESKNVTKNTHKIIILNHGLLGSSTDWVLLGPQKALPYLLSDAGYDVWLPNFRGNKYSKAHVTKVVESVDFWDFSWHEIGLFDMSAVIDYIREITSGQSEINFIAYSMSGSALLVLLSTSLRYNTILKSVTLFAPLAFMNSVRGPMQYLSQLYIQNYRSDLSFNINNEFQAERLFGEKYIDKYCIANVEKCKNPLLLMADGGKDISNIHLKTMIYKNVPSSGSSKTITHYLQLIKSREFQMFDLGEINNYEKYGSLSPPFYELKNIKAPLIIFYSVHDWLSTVPNVVKLLFYIPGTIKKYVIEKNNFSHLDFMWSESAPELIYFPLIKELQKF